MNLSEKLNLNYPKTVALEKVMNDYYARFGRRPASESGYNGIYEYCLKIKERQDKGEIIADEDYINVPSGCGRCNNVYAGYFTVNFWYALYQPETIENKIEFENQLNQFMHEVDLASSNTVNSCDRINMNNAIKYYYNRSLKAEEVMEILHITRPTLCAYVKKGLIKVDQELNGQYKYNNSSVYALLDGKKKH